MGAGLYEGLTAFGSVGNIQIHTVQCARLSLIYLLVHVHKNQWFMTNVMREGGGGGGGGGGGRGGS